MILEDESFQANESFTDSQRLIDDVDAVGLFVNHALEAFDLAGDNAKAMDSPLFNLPVHSSKDTPWGY